MVSSTALKYLGGGKVYQFLGCYINTHNVSGFEGSLTTSSGNRTYRALNIAATAPTLIDPRDGYTCFGNFPIQDNQNDLFAIGAGSNGSPANCFVAGNDGTDDYIKIGDTKLTEAQLQALLATL